MNDRIQEAGKALNQASDQVRVAREEVHAELDLLFDTGAAKYLAKSLRGGAGQEELAQAIETWHAKGEAHRAASQAFVDAIRANAEEAARALHPQQEAPQ